MQEKVTVMSAEQYFRKFAEEGIGKGADRWMVKRQIIDAFRKEIFGLVAMRAKKQFHDIPPEGDPEASRIAKNVIHDATMKYKKLCGMFAKYKETAGLLKPDDLKLYDEIEEIGTTTEDLQDADAGNDIEEDQGNAGGDLGDAESSDEGTSGDESDQPERIEDTGD